MAQPHFPSRDSLTSLNRPQICDAHVLDQQQQGPSPGQRSSSHLDDALSPLHAYVGRGSYVGDHVPFTEAMALPSRPPSPKPALSGLDQQFLQLQKSFELPSRSLQSSLVDAVMEHCYPWMPIVEKQWFDAGNKHSMLLLQAAFVAGSRMSSNHAASSEYYQRAKTLFLHGREESTVISIVAACLLQWFNPTGPEVISTDTSGFWLRTAVDLAHQVGLHREPVDGPARGFRRRLWWTLVVRMPFLSRSDC